MDKVIWLDQAGTIRGSKILLDTNIWVMIEGFGEGAPQRKVEAYSAAYDALLRNDNQIVYNDYVINEFCNICARIEYGTANAAKRQGDRLAFKEFRRTDAFRGAMTFVREACLNIMDACRYEEVRAEEDIDRTVHELSEGYLDFTDIVLSRYCRRAGVILMTDDGDFRHRGLTILTANRAYLEHPPAGPDPHE